MFTRLHMSVDEAMHEFSLIVKNVYEPRFDRPSKRSKALRACLERMLDRKGYDSLSKLLVEEGSHERRCAG